MVKAAAGGGGRGIRVAENEEELRKAVRVARQEAEKAFGDGSSTWRSSSSARATSRSR